MDNEKEIQDAERSENNENPEEQSIQGFSQYENKGLTGLANLGNTCFMNTTLQCLSHSYEFNDFLNKKHYEKNLNKNCEALILVEWDKLRQLMWSDNCVISPGGFLSNVHKTATIKDRQIFTGFAQNDLPEFLYFLIESFHNAIKRPVNMNIQGNIVNDVDVVAEKCYAMMKTMFKKEYSEILHIFFGIHVSQIINQEKEIVSQTPEPFFLIHLPLPSQKENTSPTLYDCLDLYTGDEKLEDENMWYNEKTNAKEIASRNIKFFTLPEILVVDLKRFDNNLKKNNALVDFPLENLDLSKYVIGYKKEHYVYTLYGVCNHSGSTMGGHYTAYVENANGKWYEFNDTRITEIKNPSKIVSQKAYCLFYRKNKV
jgi:ubiquitin carboxyl-terminal hydrolase 2